MFIVPRTIGNAGKRDQPINKGYSGIPGLAFHIRRAWCVKLSVLTEIEPPRNAILMVIYIYEYCTSCHKNPGDRGKQCKRKRNAASVYINNTWDFLDSTIYCQSNRWFLCGLFKTKHLWFFKDNVQNSKTKVRNRNLCCCENDINRTDCRRQNAKTR